jgi:putative Holliday junction resolvase
MPEQSRRPAARTVLAFDFGLQRIGVAVAEAETRTAHPLPVIRAQTAPGRFTAIAALVKEWRPDLLIVGRPLAEGGQATEMTRRAERFARQLGGRFQVSVRLVDEGYSSAEAESRMRSAFGSRRAAQMSRGKMLDSHAALILAEQFFGEQAA